MPQQKTVDRRSKCQVKNRLDRRNLERKRAGSVHDGDFATPRRFLTYHELKRERLETINAFFKTAARTFRNEVFRTLGS